MNNVSSAKGIRISASQAKVLPFRSISKSSGKYSLRAPSASSPYSFGAKAFKLLIGRIVKSYWKGV
jgi:hypothetical protein